MRESTQQLVDLIPAAVFTITLPAVCSNSVLTHLSSPLSVATRNTRAFEAAEALAPSLYSTVNCEQAHTSDQ